jgi:hypothetical protein
MKVKTTYLLARPPSIRCGSAASFGSPLPVTGWC